MAQNKFYRILSVAVMATVLTALLAVTAFAEITGGFGEILGLEDGKTYSVKEATINADGTGVAFGEAYKLTENKDLAGLYSVKEEDGEWSDLIYVYGDFTARNSIGEWDPDTLKPTGEYGTAFNPGVWNTSWNEVSYQPWYKSYASSGAYTLSGTYQTSPADEELYYILTTPYDTAMAAIDTAKQKADFEKAFNSTTSGYPKYYNTEPVLNPETNEETGDVVYTTLKDEYVDDIETVANRLISSMVDASAKYAYTADEIVPVNELKTFWVATNIPQSSIYLKNAATTVTFYVMDEKGTVADYTYTSPNRANEISGTSFVKKLTFSLSKAFLKRGG